jgi:chemotaxis response regulator CheB
MRIGIVNDLPTAVEALRRALVGKPEHRIIWVARDGAEAVQLCSTAPADLVLMDLVMPQMDGIEATRRIMTDTPCAILVVTASVGANASGVFDAMGQGALDAADTPVLGGGEAHESVTSFLRKIDMIAALVSTGGLFPQADGVGESCIIARREQLVAIGSSAGGPAALATLLRGIPKDFTAAIVIVQHVDECFVAGMANWLTRDSRLPVRLAREGEHPTAGTVLLARTKDHLTLKAPDRLGYTSHPSEAIYRPSIDVFFESVCALWAGDVVGVLLTGMGRDGAKGLKALRSKGHYTIAQDRATSAVYGMPRAAAALDAAVDILPLEHIAPRLADTFRSKQ